MFGRPGPALVVPIILVGIIATAVAVFGRQNDSEFVARQQNLAAITPAALEHLVTTARDPRPGMGRHRGSGSQCSSHGVGEFRNPWICTVRYPVGPSVRYRVTIDPSGQVHGASPDGTLALYGCCVGFRPTQ